MVILMLVLFFISIITSMWISPYMSETAPRPILAAILCTSFVVMLASGWYLLWVIFKYTVKVIAAS